MATLHIDSSALAYQFNADFGDSINIEDILDASDCSSSSRGNNSESFETTECTCSEYSETGLHASYCSFIPF